MALTSLKNLFNKLVSPLFSSANEQKKVIAQENKESIFVQKEVKRIHKKATKHIKKHPNKNSARFKLGQHVDSFLNTRVESVSTRVKQSILLDSIDYKPTTVSAEVRATLKKMRDSDNQAAKEKQQRIQARKETQIPWNEQEQNKERLTQLSSISQRVEEYREKNFGKEIPGYEVIELNDGEIFASWHDDNESNIVNTTTNKNATTFKLT